jgi:hypothetical protein
MYVVECYLTYLILSLAVTIWVARTLYRNGRLFLIQAFQGDAGLAESVNHLLVVGFYLINIGYVAVALSTAGTPANLRQSIELVSEKVGVVLLVLGAMHFFNLFVLSRIRVHSKSKTAPQNLERRTA